MDDELQDPESVKHIMAAISPGSRIVHYDALIQGAMNAYGEYLEKNTEVKKFAEIVNNI